MSNVSVRNGGRDADVSWTLLKSSLWLRGAFVTAAVAFLGILMLFGDDPDVLRALTQIIGGGIGTAYALRRSWQLLNTGEDAGVAPVKTAAASRLSFNRSH